MNPVSQLFKKDVRLHEEADRAFPQSLILAEYLASRVKAHNGSLTVLRVLIEELKDAVKDPDPVSVDDYTRLSVEGCNEHVVCLAKALRRAGVDTCGRNMVLTSRLGKPDPSEATDLKSCVMRPDPEVDINHLEDYTHIFMCAMAMLMGIEIDPKAEAA